MKGDVKSYQIFATEFAENWVILGHFYHAQCKLHTYYLKAIFNKLVERIARPLSLHKQIDQKQFQSLVPAN